MVDISRVEPYDGPPDPLPDALKDLYRKTHETIQRVTRDIEDRFHFNTAISAVMELVNTLSGLDTTQNDSRTSPVVRKAFESIILLLSPIVPHYSEELWEALGYSDSVLLTPWPTFRKDALTKEERLIVIQVNGKLRSRLTVPSDADENAIKAAALADEKAQGFYAGKTIRKVIVVKDKLVNIVCGH
jgi:leucyl-tRNA synthetase